MKRKSVRKGYVTVYMPDHHRAYGGFVYEHILVAEKMLGRNLKDNEDVHHLNLNEQDNRSENLLVLEHGQHTKLHNFMKRHGMYDAFRNTADAGHYVRECEYCSDYIVNVGNVNHSRKFCDSDCRNKNKENRPSVGALNYLLNTRNKVEVGNIFGVHRSTINLWLREHTENN